MDELKGVDFSGFSSKYVEASFPKKSEINHTECKGIVGRYYEGSYFTKKGYETKKGFRKLMRKSCAGCDKCAWVDEFLSDVCYLDFDEKLEDGQLCYIHISGGERYETCDGTDYTDPEFTIKPIT